MTMMPARDVPRSMFSGAAPQVAPIVKRSRPIEDLLRWAFREELPKDRDCGAVEARAGAMGFGHAWGSVTAYGELLTTIDDGGYNRWGVVPFGTAVRGDPHPDAMAIADAVADLDGLELDLPDDWAPLADLGEMGGHGPRVLAAALDRLTVTERDGTRRLKISLRRLVFRHAILGGCPVFEADVPEVLPICGANGKPKWFVMRRVAIGSDAFDQPIYEMREFDGLNAKSQRPYDGAYRKTRLEPDPTDAAVARAEYEVWRAALDVLVADLSGALTAHEATPSPRARRPWEEGVAPKGAVLPDLTAAARFSY